MAWEMKSQIKGAPRTFERAFICIERYSTGEPPDWDNLIGGIKPLIDCLVTPTKANPSGIGIIRDDNPDCIPIQPIVVPVRVKRRSEQRTAVNVIELLSSPKTGERNEDFESNV